MRLNVNLPPRSYLFAKVILKVFYPLEIYQHTTFHGFTLTGACFASFSEDRTSAILECLNVRNYGIGVTFSVITSVLNFIKIS
jgi:hypothetical protein